MSEKRLEHYIELKRLVDILYDVQDVRMRTANRERGLPGETESLYSHRLEEIEKNVERDVAEHLKGEPIYVEWLSQVKGVGPRLSGGWISNIMVSYKPLKDVKEPSEVQLKFAIKTKGGKILIPCLRGIGAFPTISALWKYCGLDVEIDESGIGRAPKRQRKKKYGRNPRMTVLAWKTRKQFVMQGGHYRQLYDKYKQEYLAGPYGSYLKDPTLCPRYEECKGKLTRTAKRLERKPKKLPCLKHIDNMAARRMSKDFTKDLWTTWRQVEGLPVTESYEVAVLGHKHENMPAID